jgi:hypothetical protein
MTDAQGQSRLSPQATKLINDKLSQTPGSPTVAEYLRAAPLVREYMAAPMFDNLSPDQIKQLEAERKEHARLAARDRVDGTTTAKDYARVHPLVLQAHPVSRERKAILSRNKWLAPYVAGTTFIQQGGK